MIVDRTRLVVKDLDPHKVLIPVKKACPLLG